jgi:tetratricopeptide (TPR) repeat protein
MLRFYCLSQSQPSRPSLGTGPPANYSLKQTAAESLRYPDTHRGSGAGLGQIERDRGHIDHAQQHYTDALALCRRQKFPLRTAHIARHLGDIYRESGLVQQAEALLTQAIFLYRQDLDTRALDLANAIRPLALLKTTQGDADSARSHWQEAQVLYSAVNVEAGAAECAAQLAKLPRSA